MVIDSFLVDCTILFFFNFRTHYSFASCILKIQSSVRKKEIIHYVVCKLSFSIFTGFSASVFGSCLVMLRIISGRGQGTMCGAMG